MEPVRSWNRVCDQLCLAAETASDFDLTLFPGVDAAKLWILFTTKNVITKSQF